MLYGAASNIDGFLCRDKRVSSTQGKSLVVGNRAFLNLETPQLQ
jgi:hypothetical protein